MSQRHSTAMAYGLFEMKVGAGDTILAWMTNQAEHVRWRSNVSCSVSLMH